MNILFNPRQINQGLAIAIGNFDGLHLGHKKIIARTLEIARENGLKPAVITFEPHPVSLFRPEKLPIRLTTFKDKIELLEDEGIKEVIVLKFNKAFAEMSAEEFVKLLGQNHVITGEDFCFGKARQGNSALLKQSLGEKYYAISPQGGDEKYSSSIVRKALKTGDIAKANMVLGHNYFVQGRVVNGKGDGKKFGFPTANIKFRTGLIRPQYGVYAVKTNFGVGVANFGIRPTLDGNNELLEVHIFGFNENIYGKKLKVEFLEFIRPELKFGSIEELKKQIKEDCERAKAIHSK